MFDGRASGFVASGVEVGLYSCFQHGSRKKSALNFRLQP